MNINVLTCGIFHNNKKLLREVFQTVILFEILLNKWNVFMQ